MADHHFQSEQYARNRCIERSRNTAGHPTADKGAGDGRGEMQAIPNERSQSRCQMHHRAFAPHRSAKAQSRGIGKGIGKGGSDGHPAIAQGHRLDYLRHPQRSFFGHQKAQKPGHQKPAGNGDQHDLPPCIKASPPIR